MNFGLKLNGAHSSPKERQLQKSCVSFGEECIISAFSYQPQCPWGYSHKSPDHRHTDKVHTLIMTLFSCIRQAESLILTTMHKALTLTYGLWPLH